MSLRNDTVSFWFWCYIGDKRTELQAPVLPLRVFHKGNSNFQVPAITSWSLRLSRELISWPGSEVNIKSNVLGNVQVVPSYGHSSGQSTSLKLESLCGKICDTLWKCPIIQVKNATITYYRPTHCTVRKRQTMIETWHSEHNKIK